MGKFGIKTMGKISNQVSQLLTKHGFDIEAAYLRFGDEKFPINFKVTVEPKGKGNAVTVKISFKPEPEKQDEITDIVDEDQMDLFQDLKEGESVTISHGD